MLIRIGSSDNSRVRLVRKLGTKKGRTAERKFVIEGLNLVREAVTESLDIDFIMIPDDFNSSEGSDISGLISFTRECIDSPDLKVCMVPAKLFSGITDARAGIGILAVLKMPEADISDIYSLPLDSNILVLDRIQDPGNIGTMIRTAAAAGYGMIIAVKGTADIYSAKVLRATAFILALTELHAYLQLRCHLNLTNLHANHKVIIYTHILQTHIAYEVAKRTISLHIHAYGVRHFLTIRSADMPETEGNALGYHLHLRVL